MQYYNVCHHFKANCTAWDVGSLHCSPDPLAVFKGPVSKGMKWERREDLQGRREERREGPVKSVKPRARKVASTLLMLRVQRGLVKKLMP